MPEPEPDERRAMEAALRASEAAQRFLADSIPAQVWTAQPDGRLDHVNHQVLEYFARTREQMLGEGWQAVIHPLDLPACVERWSASLATGAPYEVEFRLRRADGEYRWHIARARALRDEAGQVVRWYGTNTDIDEQKRVGQAQRFILAASDLLAASLDPEVGLASVARLAVPHIATWCSIDLLEAGEPSPGGAPGEPELRRVTVAHADPSKVALAQELHRRYPVDLRAANGVGGVLRSGVPELIAVIEDWMLVAGCKDAEQLRIARELGLSSSMVVPLQVRGRTLGAISLVAAEPGRHFNADDLRLAEALALRCAQALDSAQLLRQAQDAEQALRRLNEDLERRVAERTQELKQARERALEANARLKQLDATKDDFLNALSYQLATPINAVLGYGDLLLAGAGGPLREEQRQYVRRISASSRVLLALVHDLLDMSRMTAGKFALDREPVEPGALASQALAYLEPLCEMQALRVVSRIAEPLPEVPADPQRLEQVLANLLHNAIQLTPAGGLLRVSVEPIDAVVRVEVHHTGASLGPAELEQIFRRFTRVGGAWLGLSLARQVIAAHGGTMGVHADPGGGNTFWFTLPRA